MVSVAIAVTSSGTFRSVQYHGEVFKSFSGIHIFQFGKHGPVQQAGADYENGAVRPFFNNLCVGYDVNASISIDNLLSSSSSVGLGGTVPMGRMCRFVYPL